MGVTSQPPEPSHEYWMRIALAMADQAGAAGEVPVGAVLVGPQGEIARGGNQPISDCDPTAHAEVVTLRRAGRALGNYRLPGSTLYATVEPCTMCAGAMIHARVARLVFGAREPKAGAIVSRPERLEGLNHRPEVFEGVLEEECRERLQEFFALKRARGPDGST